MEGRSLWSNSKQFIGVTANARAGEKVFKFLRLEFITCNLVRVTMVNCKYAMSDKNDEICDLALDRVDEPTNECTSKTS